MRFGCLQALSSSALFLLFILPNISSSYEISINHGEVTDSDRRVLLEIARAVKRVKRNPFARDEITSSRSSSDSDLREKEDDNGDNTGDEESEVGHEKTEHFQGSASDYCDKFEQHFSYFCVGETDQTDKNAYVIKKFCPSYKNACKHKAVSSSVSLTSWPTDPFAKEISVATRPVTVGRTPSHSRRRYSDEESDSDSAEDEEIYYAELRKRYPCKPDCDRRIFAHCTEECKCDYIYPVVQRFCNPPPMPMFLNTCRLWYHGCPKYERYHYSSQFVYSKAEKGKVLPGTPEQSAVNPYGLPQPAPLRRNRALALAPIRRQKRDAVDDSENNEDLVVPPPVPASEIASIRVAKSSPIETEREEVPLTAPQSRAILQNYHESMKSEEKKRRSRRKKLRRRRRHRQRYSFDKDFETISTTQRPPTPRELWRTLKQLNSLTSGPGALGIKSSPATLKGGNEAQGGLDGLLASVTKPQTERDETARQWAAVATNPKQLTEDIVHAVSTEPNDQTEKQNRGGKKKGEEEPDFNKIKPRTFSSSAATTAIVDEQPEQPDGPKKASSGRAKAHQGNIPILPSDAAFAARGGGDDTFRAFDGLSDSRGLVHTPRSRSPFTKPGLWEPNPADPHSRDAANKYWYHPESVGVDWLNGQLQWGGHWAVPAAGAGGTAGMSAVHFPTIGSFLNIPDDYD
ncbi:CRE-OSM-7 protein [Caenorhabditis remanei]|uniref:CRE-OSM-7 protein n=1 Tax=Caenorhabditis remanei TaxID=31234 RepID=E3LYL0_CAERE|nr:CRE-OSM-7 protein [Caenorhabditis remanei]